MVDLFEAGCRHVEEVNGGFFYFQDFSFYHTVIAPRFQLFCNPLLGAGMWLLLFYIGSAVLFCPIMKDDVVCPNRDTYEGWLTAVYFASVTMVSPRVVG